MPGPIDAVVAIHNAFRNDMRLIDAAALDSARGKPGLEATVERFRGGSTPVGRKSPGRPPVGLSPRGSPSATRWRPCSNDRARGTGRPTCPTGDR